MSKALRLLILFFLPTHFAMAQLCQGSLGDPIVNITFGTGANPGGALSAAATSYQYVSTDCPNDGFYAVRNSTTGCFGNSWQNLATDHSGNFGGYFMLINASYQPGAFYIDTVRGLCGNSTYEFAAWVVNMLLQSACGGTGIQPNLTFTIERTDGTVLQTYNSGDISSTSTPNWKQYGFYFTTPPAGSDIVLRIVNNAPGGCGNDLALDDITFRPCGPLTTPSIDGQPYAPVSFCQGTAHSYLLSCTTSGGFTNPVFQWQAMDPGTNAWIDIPGANAASFTAAFPTTTPVGTYAFRMAVAEAGNINSSQCRVYSKPFIFTVNDNPVTTAKNDGPSCIGSSATLTATGGSQYSWDGPAGNIGNNNPTIINNIQFAQAGRYYVTVTNSASCSKKDSTDIIVNPAPTAATAFSNATICAGDTIQLSGSGGPSYLWYPSSALSSTSIADPKAAPRSSTTYYMVVTNSYGCKDTASTHIIVNPGPIAKAGPDKVIIKGQSVMLEGYANIAQGNNISWEPALNINDPFSLHPLVDPPVERNYILKVVSSSGCGSSTDTVNVKVYNSLFIPNTFTPNHDGKNDTWDISALAAYSSFELSVYNRWGQLIYHATNVYTPWNGKYKDEPCPSGSYIYFINTSGGMVKGSVLLLR